MIYSHSNYVPVALGTKNDAATDPDCQPGHTTYACGLTGFFPVPGVNHGVYGAVNILTGKVAWTIPVLTTAPGSGVTVAGDLVFFGDSTGLFYAASAATGEILWVFDAATEPKAGGGARTLARGIGDFIIRSAIFRHPANSPPTWR